MDVGPGSDATVQTWWRNHSRCGGGVRVRRNLRAADALEVPQTLPDVLHIPESKSCFVLCEVARVRFNTGPPPPCPSPSIHCQSDLVPSRRLAEPQASVQRRILTGANGL